MQDSTELSRVADGQNEMIMLLHETINGLNQKFYGEEILRSMNVLASRFLFSFLLHLKLTTNRGARTTECIPG